MNAGLLEIAEILLRFEVERIEKRKAASEGIRQDNASEAASTTQAEAAQPGHYATRRPARQNQE